MKIVLINAATLPIYRDELARLLTDAVTHGASVGYDTLIPHEDAESYFHSLRPALAKVNCCCGLPVTSAASLAPCNSSSVRSRTAVIVRR